MHEHLNSLRVRGYSEHTVKNRLVHIGFFIQWAYEHGLREPHEITRPVLERYQRHLFYYRKKNGEPLTFRSQHSRLVPLRVWFKLDDAAEPHPAQSGIGDRLAARWAARCRRTSFPCKRSSR